MRRSRRRPEKERHLYRYKPENRLAGLRAYFDSSERVGLVVRGEAALALLIRRGESIPFSCFNAGYDMIALYGRVPGEKAVGVLGYVTLSRLGRKRPGQGLRVRSLNELYWTSLDGEQVSRLKDLAAGRALMPRPRSRLSPLAGRLELAGA